MTAHRFGSDELDLLHRAITLHIETTAEGKTFRTMTWVVVDDGAVYVRSYRGEAGRWYQRALADPEVALIDGDTRVEARAVRIGDDQQIAAVSEGFVAKYGTNQWVDSMVVPDVLGTTLRLDPLSG